MKKVLYIILIFLITLAIFSCAEDEPFYSNPFTDTTAPVIEEVTFVTTPTNDSTPDYTFSSDEAGTITYGGSCSSSTTSAIDGNNTITLVSLSEGTYSDCTITVTDEAGNISITLTITSFIVDTTVPVISGSTITTPTNDSTPNYTFSSDEAGTITYGGSCSSANKSAISGNNIITLNSLSDGTYSNCTITVTDSAGNSVTLNITSFTVAIPPTIEEVTFVTTPTNDSTPDYTFSSDEAGTITYGGSCSSTTTSAIDGNNTITFYSIHSSGIFLVSLNEGTYSDCTITVTDSAGNVSNTHKITPFIVDLTAATLAEVTAVTTPTNDSTPDYTFSSSEAGTITYGGSCFSITTSATTGNNTITLISLNEGTYKKCKITVTDSAGNSVTLNIGLFVIDTTAPTVSSISPTDNQSSVSITDNITVTFSDAMDTTYVTTNTDNTSCYGNLGVSSDNFSSCVQMASAPASSNSNMTFTLDPYDNLTVSTTYKTRVTTGVKDAAGNAMSSQYETSSGFITTSSSSSSSSGVFVAVGNNGAIIRSTDNGTTWDNATSPTNSNFSWGDAVTFGNNTFVAVGASGTIVRSTDNGSSFDNVTKVDNTDLNGVAFGNNTFVAVGASGKIVKSTDNGSTFSAVTPPITTGINGVTFGNNTFVAVGVSGNIVRSTDNGTSWDNASSGITTQIEDVTFGNNTFVAVARSGNIVRSTDNGTSWDNATDPVSGTIWGVGFGNNTFVAVVHGGTILRSTDNGSNFITVVDAGDHLTGVGFGNNTFVVVGVNGELHRSTDNGTNWESKKSVNPVGTNERLNSVAF